MTLATDSPVRIPRIYLSILIFTAFVPPRAFGAPADADARLEQVLVKKSVSKAGLIGTDARRHVPPATHDTGDFQCGLYRRHTDVPRLVKLVDAEAYASVEDTLNELNFELSGLLLAEPLGGPRIFHGGLFHDRHQRGYYVEMEFLFADEPRTLTYKGTALDPDDPAIGFGIENCLDPLADRIASVLNERIYANDIDFIMSPGGVRWLDTALWRRAPNWMDTIDADLAGVLDWAEGTRAGYGEKLYRRLTQKISHSPTLRTAERRQVLQSLARVWRGCAARLDR